MTNVFKTLLEGSPLEIRTTLFESLNTIAEKHLVEYRKMTIAKMFDVPFTSEPLVPRATWTKQYIREALEEATLNSISNKTLNENYSQIQSMHDSLKQRGFKHINSYPVGTDGHANTYEHPKEGHKVHVNSATKAYEIMQSSGAHLVGVGHNDLHHHLKHLSEG